MTTESSRGQQRILHAHRVLFRAGLTLVSAFGWIFVFNFSLAFSGSVARSFLVAILVYALSQAVILVATPLSAAHLRHGMKRALLFGALFAALAYATLASTLAGFFSAPLGWGLVLFGLLLGGYRVLYWIPYRLQSAAGQQKTNLFFEVLVALLPAFAGVTLVGVDLSAFRLLSGAAALLTLSILPMLFLKDSGESFRWGYVETFAKLFDRRYQTLALRSALAGIESTTLVLLWPLAVFLIVGRSYLIFGLVISASLLILLIFRREYRRLMRKAALHASVPIEVAFSVSGWLLRLAAGTPLMIVFADSYSFVSAPSGTIEFPPVEYAADAGTYVDEYTALQEIGLSFGRIVMCLFTGALLFTMPLSVVLALALIVTAFVAGAAAVLAHKIRLEAY